MAAVKKFYTDLDGLKIGKLINWITNPLTTADRTSLGLTLGITNAGLLVFDTTLEELFVWNGTTWASGSGGGGSVWGTITGTLSNQIDLQNALNAKANTSSLATVAFSGSYNDLSNKPSIPAAQVNSDWNAVSGVAQILNKPTIPAAQVNSDWNAVSGVAQILNKPTLATVATTGSYTDLTNKPTIYSFSGTSLQYTKGDGTYATFPTNVSSFTNDSGYITASSTSTLTNKSGNISQWTNDVGYITSGSISNAVVQGGNSFGTNLLIGANDGFGTYFTIGGTPYVVMASNGMFANYNGNWYIFQNGSGAFSSGTFAWDAAGNITSGVWQGTPITDTYISSASTWNAKQNAISLTTTGNNGSATFGSNVLNVPTYTLAGLGGIGLTSLSATTPLQYNNATGVFTIIQATTSTSGYLSNTDWNTFNSKQSTISLTVTGNNGSATLVAGTLNIPTYTLAGLGGIGLTSLSASAPLTYNNGTGAFTITQATTSTNGYLSSTDWNTFNTKQSALTISTGLTNTSGTVTANLSTGVSGGQTAVGGTASGNNLTLSSTSNSTKGSILFGTSAYVESSNRLGIGQTSPQAAIDITTNALGVTPVNTSGLLLANTTAAASGAQQISPEVRFRGFGWGTTAGTSQSVDFIEYVLPVQGTTPTGTLTWAASIAGGTYGTAMTLTSAGILTTAAQINAGSNITSSLSMIVASTGSFQWNVGTTPLMGNPAAYTVGISNTTNPTALRIYNTLGTNSEYMELGFKANSNIFTIGSAITGTGTLRSIQLASKVGMGTTPLSTTQFAVAASTTTVSSLNIASGTAPTSPVNGDMWATGTNLFFVRSGTTTESVFTGVSGATAPTATVGPTTTSYYGANSTNALCTPNSWASVVINGTTYKIPLYT